MTTDLDSPIQRLACVESIAERVIQEYNETTHKFRVYYEIDNCGELTISETEDNLVSFASLMKEVAAIMQVLIENR